MKCAYLVKNCKVSSCMRLDRPYVPSIFQLEEYCRTDGHRKCPFYLKDVLSLRHLDGNSVLSAG